MAKDYSYILAIRHNETRGNFDKDAKIVWCPTGCGRPARVYFDGERERYSCMIGHQGIYEGD